MYFLKSLFFLVLEVLSLPFTLLLFKMSIRERYDERIGMPTQEFRGFKLRRWVVRLSESLRVPADPYRIYFRQ